MTSTTKQEEGEKEGKEEHGDDEKDMSRTQRENTLPLLKFRRLRGRSLGCAGHTKFAVTLTGTKIGDIIKRHTDKVHRGGSAYVDLPSSSSISISLLACFPR